MLEYCFLEVEEESSFPYNVNHHPGVTTQKLNKGKVIIRSNYSSGHQGTGLT